MKKMVLLVVTMFAGILLVGCGKHNESSQNKNTQSVIQKEKSVDHKVSSSPVKLAANNLTPQENAALVMYYGGVKNNQNYVRKIDEKGQQINVTLYNINDADRFKIRGDIPAGAQILYSVKLKEGKGSAYYTIVGNNTYILDNHNGFMKEPFTTDEMVSLANKNNAGAMIKNVSLDSQINAKRNDTSNESETNNEPEKMTFDEAASLIEKGGFTDFSYESAMQLPMVVI
ncbi:hypothetical protein [Limosilactobacillus walteri]|uniref:Lipoprotein n=1 Tax=Limosilactobacillus walteri TaxID=2268022 RepID=A0ABR8P596_9LACO|nr:hypothetical protein [Limosilactobacillus walteri]MBD5805538.1 hypothetical protein [Limosilactobacillus walteri]